MESEITKSSKEYESLKIRSSSLSEGKDYDELKTLLYDMLTWMNNIVELYERSTDDLKEELAGTLHQLKDIKSQVNVMDDSLKKAKEHYVLELNIVKADSENNKRRFEKMVDTISGELKKCKRIKKRDPYEGI